MLNPSYADQYRNDPTIIRVIKRASLLGYGSIIVGNIGAGRATHPRDWKEMHDPIGPGNKRALRRILNEAHDRHGIVVVGWGAHAEEWMVRDFCKLARHAGVKLWCLGTTKDGAPLHPLHVAYGVKLRRYRGDTWNA